MIKKIGPRTRALATATVLATAVAGGVMTATAASASTPPPLNCSSGLNNATTAWFTCTGSGNWDGYVNCYYWPGSSTGWVNQSGGTVKRWLSCSTYVSGWGFEPGTTQ